MTTPMMRQYREIKLQHPDAILFFRLGDFYEMFGDDAVTASRILEITLTSRDSNKENPLPMCGVPYHAANNYLSKLLEHGYKVAICEQVEDPSTAKGIVEREVVRVVTPGTVYDNSMLSDKRNNYLGAVCRVAGVWGLAFVDVSTGEFCITELATDNFSKVLDEMQRYELRECVLPKTTPDDFYRLVSQLCLVTGYPEKLWSAARAHQQLEKLFGRFDLESFGCTGCDAAVTAGSILMNYLQETQKRSLSHINKIQVYTPRDYMLLDGAARRNLELLETMRAKERRGSLLWVLDKTFTAMGARLLKKYIIQPLLQADAIEARLGAVEELKDSYFIREKLGECLRLVYDLERLVSKIIFQSANARDLLALNSSLKVLPAVKEQLAACSGPLLKEAARQLDTLTDLQQLIDSSISIDPPVSITEGGIIKDGFDAEIDRLRQAAGSGRRWLAELEQEEKQQTGIKSLKIKYNKVFGYYIEVTRANLALVPQRYQRKQTLANAERFITPKLKELEDTILGAEDKLTRLEYEAFCRIREQISAENRRIQRSAEIIARLDVLQSLARVAADNNYCRPSIAPAKAMLEITEGRHPVVERLVEAGQFVANDTYLGKETELIIITGPNMAGKSTYMRQVALITLMAQIGSFVPAAAARIPLVDRIFTRVGAADDLSTGQSTFMVEMNEVANILHNASRRSLIILDEIGRGTSTYDGMAIAWAVIEYILREKQGAKTLFATHYHQLTALEQMYSGLKNFQVAVKEQGEEIAFLRKIIPGATDKSYGVQVARLAGLPYQVIKRAEGLLREIEEQETAPARMETAAAREEQLALFDTSAGYHKTAAALKALDIVSITPLEALNTLAKLQQLVLEEEEHGAD